LRVFIIIIIIDTALGSSFPRAKNINENVAKNLYVCFDCFFYGIFRTVAERVGEAKKTLLNRCTATEKRWKMKEVVCGFSVEAEIRRPNSAMNSRPSLLIGHIVLKARRRR
jgi:hypothetical protein